MERGSWRSTHLLFACERLLAFYRSNRHQALMNCISSARLLPTPCFTRNGVFWDACWSWLGARPRTALWQTGGNGTHAVRSAVGRAVGRTAGQDCGTGGRPTGYSLCKGSIPLGGSPRLLSVARALLPKRVFYLEGGGRKPGQWERARARVRQTWGFFMDVYSGEAYGRRVRVFQVLCVLMVCINCLLYQGVRTLRKEHYLWDYQFMYHIA